MFLRDIAKKIYNEVVNVLPDDIAVNIQYLRWFGRLPNLKNPTKYTEKVNWRKLYQRNPLFATCVDKLAVKAEVAKVLGPQYVLPTLWSGTDPEAIPFDTLKPPYVIKTNAGSGTNIFIRSAQDIDRCAIYASLREALSISYGHLWREWAYTQVKPQIFIEPMLIHNGDVPEDYKCFVFNGRTLYIQVDWDRFKGHKLNWYDRDWQRQDLRIGNRPNIPFDVPRPARLDDMMRLSELFAAPFDFVRVDWYAMPEGIYFGEATFYPCAGLDTMHPISWDDRIGALWRLDRSLEPVKAAPPIGSVAKT